MYNLNKTIKEFIQDDLQFSSYELLNEVLELINLKEHTTIYLEHTKNNVEYIDIFKHSKKLNSNCLKKYSFSLHKIKFFNSQQSTHHSSISKMKNSIQYSLSDGSIYSSNELQSTSPPPPPPYGTHLVGGNNGSKSCDTFCRYYAVNVGGRGANPELSGSICVDTSNIPNVFPDCSTVWNNTAPHPASACICRPSIFDKLRTFLRSDTESAWDLSNSAADIVLTDKKNSYDLSTDLSLVNFLKTGKAISQEDWFGINWTDGRLGTGVKRIWSSGTSLTIKATGWTQPMFLYEPSAIYSTVEDNSLLILQNINFDLSGFTDSAIRLSNYKINRTQKHQEAAFQTWNPDASGTHGLILLNVTGNIQNFIGNSTIFISSRGATNDPGGMIDCSSIGVRGDYTTCTNVEDTLSKKCICQSDDNGDPRWLGLLVFIDCSLTFQNNQIGNVGASGNVKARGLYHGGAAIYVKNGAGQGNGAGITYKNSKLSFINNRTTLASSYYRAGGHGGFIHAPDKTIYGLENFYRYYPEGGGAIRTNNFVGGGGKDTTNILIFTNNKITIGSMVRNSRTDDAFSAPSDISDVSASYYNWLNGISRDIGDGAWGGAVYMNDGWWGQQSSDGTTFIGASGNIADWGAVGYASGVQNGSIMLGGTEGDWIDNSSQGTSKGTSATFAGGGCDESTFPGFSCCYVDDRGNILCSKPVPHKHTPTPNPTPNPTPKPSNPTPAPCSKCLAPKQTCKIACRAGGKFTDGWCEYPDSSDPGRCCRCTSTKNDLLSIKIKNNCPGYDDLNSGGNPWVNKYLCGKDTSANQSNLASNTVYATAYWDCGFGKTLLKNDRNKQGTGTNFAPLWVGNDAQINGLNKTYNEDIWMTAAFSADLNNNIEGSWAKAFAKPYINYDSLSDKIAAGQADLNLKDWGGGRCILINNQYAKNKDWTAVVMAVDTGSDLPTAQHAQIDMAIPGFDDSDSKRQECPRKDGKNKCDTPELDDSGGDDGFFWSNAPCKKVEETSIYQEDAAQFNFNSEDVNSVECESISDAHGDSQRLVDGCKIFQEWMGTGVDASNAWRGKSLFSFIPVKCPDKFVTFIQDSLEDNSVQTQKQARENLFGKGKSDINGNLPAL